MLRFSANCWNLTSALFRSSMCCSNISYFTSEPLIRTESWHHSSNKSSYSSGRPAQMFNIMRPCSRKPTKNAIHARNARQFSDPRRLIFEKLENLMQVKSNLRRGERADLFSHSNTDKREWNGTNDEQVLDGIWQLVKSVENQIPSIFSDDCVVITLCSSIQADTSHSWTHQTDIILACRAEIMIFCGCTSWSGVMLKQQTRDLGSLDETRHDWRVV